MTTFVYYRLFWGGRQCRFGLVYLGADGIRPKARKTQKCGYVRLEAQMKRRPDMSLDRTLNLGQILSQPLTNEGWVSLINHMAIRMFMALCGAKRFTFHELGWLSSYEHSNLENNQPRVEAEEGLSLKTRGLFRYKRSEGFEKTEFGTQESKVAWGFTMQYEWILCTVTFENVPHPETPSMIYTKSTEVQICRTNLEDLLVRFKPLEIWDAFGGLAENFAGNHRESYHVAQGSYDEWTRLNQLIDDLWIFKQD